MGIDNEMFLHAAKMHQMELKCKAIGGPCVLWDRRRIKQIKNKDMVLQVEQRMLSAGCAAVIGLLAVMHSKRRDGKKNKLQMF